MASSTAPHVPVVESKIKVRYAETDAQGVVYHGNYVIWFEVGRTDYCDAAGYPYAQMEAEGALTTVIEVHARYRRSARYGDVVTVKTRMGERKSRGFTFHYEVYLPDGTLAVEGETKHLWIDREGKLRRAPDAPQAAFAAFLARC